MVCSHCKVAHKPCAVVCSHCKVTRKACAVVCGHCKASRKPCAVVYRHCKADHKACAAVCRHCNLSTQRDRRCRERSGGGGAEDGWLGRCVGTMLHGGNPAGTMRGGWETGRQPPLRGGGPACDGSVPGVGCSVPLLRAGGGQPGAIFEGFENPGLAGNDHTEGAEDAAGEGGDGRCCDECIQSVVA